MKIEIDGLPYLSVSLENNTYGFNLSFNSLKITAPRLIFVLNWPFPKFLYGRNLMNDLKDKKMWDAQLLSRLTNSAQKLFPKSRPEKIKTLIRDVMRGTSADWLVPDEWQLKHGSPRLVKVG